MQLCLGICTLIACICVGLFESTPDNCRNLTNNQHTLVIDASDHTLVVDLENKTINLCSMSTACECYQNMFTENTSRQIRPIVIPHGFSVNITTHSGEAVHFYRTTRDQFQSCTVNNNGSTPDFNISTDVYQIPMDHLHSGTNLFICDDPRDSELTCQQGCRLNITIKENECYDNASQKVCSGNGHCTSALHETKFSCRCFDGFSGKACDIINADHNTSFGCEDINCRNGGTCVTETTAKLSHNMSTWRCQCPTYFTGKYCETILNKCKSSPCVNGVCVERAEGYQCYCVPGFHGKTCELEYNECLSNPCSNRGTCIDRVDKFECHCSIGHRGVTCQEKVDLCSPNPCYRNSTCTTIHEVFQCVCPHSYTGKLCDEKVKSCASNPCNNHGTCIEFENGYQCMCAVTFAGLHCEYMMDVFAPPMEGADLSGESHKHNMYIVAGTLGSMVLIVVSVIIACYCKIYETYKQLMWKRLRYHRKRSNSCPDLETCNEPTYIGKHRLSADAIWEATSLCHDNAAFENHQTYTSMQI